MVLRALLSCGVLGTSCVLMTAAAQPVDAAPAATRAAAGRIGTTLQPTVQLVKAALSTVNVDKWKASPAIKSEADGNLQSVQRDMDQTLPGLVMAADSAPDSAAKALPVFRNVDALYDVMLRLDAAGRLAAPKDQLGALDDALSSIASARRTLGDQLQANTDAQEQRMIKLQQAVAHPPSAPVPAPVQCTPPPPSATKKKRTASKSASSATH